MSLSIYIVGYIYFILVLFIIILITGAIWIAKFKMISKEKYARYKWKMEQLSAQYEKTIEILKNDCESRVHGMYYYVALKDQKSKQRDRHCQTDETLFFEQQLEISPSTQQARSRKQNVPDNNEDDLSTVRASQRNEQHISPKSMVKTEPPVVKSEGVQNTTDNVYEVSDDSNKRFNTEDTHNEDSNNYENSVSDVSWKAIKKKT